MTPDLGPLRPGAGVEVKDHLIQCQEDGRAEAVIPMADLLHGENGRRAAGFRKYLSGLPGKASLKDFEREVGSVSDLEEPFKRYVTDFLPEAQEALRRK